MWKYNLPRLKFKSISFDDTNGFTLVEVMIAILVFSIAFVALNIMQISATQGNSDANNLSISSRVAADRIERFMSDMSYSDLADLDDSSGGLDDTVDANNNIVADGYDNSFAPNHMIYWNVAKDSPEDDAATVRVIVIRLRDGKTLKYNFIKTTLI